MRIRPVALTLSAALLASSLAVAPAVAQESDRPSDTATATDGERDARTGDRRPLERLKARAEAAIDHRLVALDRAETAIVRSQHVTAAHEDVLLALVHDESAGLAALNVAIQRAETFDEAAQLAKQIVSEHWVFARVIPQVHLTLASDRGVDVGERVLGWVAEVRERLAELPQDDPDVQQAQAAVDVVAAAAESLQDVGRRVPGQVLPIQAEDMPEAGEVIRAAADELREAVRELRRSIAAARDELDDLR